MIPLWLWFVMIGHWVITALLVFEVGRLRKLTR